MNKIILIENIKINICVCVNQENLRVQFIYILIYIIVLHTNCWCIDYYLTFSVF